MVDPQIQSKIYGEHQAIFTVNTNNGNLGILSQYRAGDPFQFDLSSVAYQQDTGNLIVFDTNERKLVEISADGISKKELDWKYNGENFLDSFEDADVLGMTALDNNNLLLTTESGIFVMELDSGNSMFFAKWIFSN